MKLAAIESQNKQFSVTESRFLTQDSAQGGNVKPKLHFKSQEITVPKRSRNKKKMPLIYKPLVRGQILLEILKAGCSLEMIRHMFSFP